MQDAIETLRLKIKSALNGIQYSTGTATSRGEHFKSKARVFLHEACKRHLPRTARTYEYTTVSLLSLGISGLGFSAFQKSFEGKLIEETEEILLFKIGRQAFGVAEKAAFKDLSVFEGKDGKKFLIEPYVAKFMDGHPVSKPRENADGSLRITLGGKPTLDLGVPFESIKSTYIKEMVEQINNLVMPDCVRTIAVALIDAGLQQGGIEIVDVEDESAAEMRPGLTFALRDMKVGLSYDLSMDTYMLYKDGELILDSHDNFTFADIGTALEILIDDQDWMYARVTEVKALKKAA